MTPSQKVRTTLLWFAPFLFLSLRSPLALLVLPLAATRFLSDSPNHWGTIFHYSAPLAPIIAMSAADGLARLARELFANRPRVVNTVAGIVVVLSGVLPGRQPMWRVLAPEYYRGVSVYAAGYEAIAMVPREASVVAQAAVVPHLSQRRSIHVLAADAPDAEYVIAANALSPWPSASADELRMLVENRRSRGYTVIFERKGWTLLRRDAVAADDRLGSGR